MKKVGEFSFLMTQVLDQTRPQDTKRKENTQALVERRWKYGGKKSVKRYIKVLSNLPSAGRHSSPTRLSRLSSTSPALHEQQGASGGGLAHADQALDTHL